MITIHHPWVFAFGILGNVISFMVFLAPLPTFIRVYKKKSTEGFQSIPYVVAIFSAMLWIYYAMLKGNSLLLITVNVAGVIIETIYVVVYLTYAPRPAKMFTLKLLLFMNFGGFCMIVLLCHYLAKGEGRIQVFGWVCVAFSVSVFAAPLSVMRLVIRTKSVEFMPFNLSLCLTLTATIWFMYGFVQKDLYITLPNVVGFVFGVVQMILYGIYRKYDKMAKNQKLPEQVVGIEIITSSSSSVKQNNTVVEAKDIICPQEKKNEAEVEVEVVIDANKAHEVNEEAGSNGHEEVYVHGPPRPDPTCNVTNHLDAMGSRPATSCSVQVVECAV